MKAVKDHNKMIGACLDTGHLIRMAQLGETLDPVAQAKIMGDRNFGFHSKGPRQQEEDRRGLRHRGRRPRPAGAC